MHTYTPGPWTVSALNGRDVGPIRALHFEGTDVRQLQSVAFVRERQESAANARLVAAAPELLAACVEAYDWIANQGDSAPASALKLSTTLRAVIATAEEP
jgi:hypothetical protein